jgi:uncharacterized protein YdaU (DUF1376 family)
MHYYKFNIADWHLATSHLSITEEAVYFKLINFYYDTELPIPLETESVMRRLRLKGNGVIVKEVLQEFFVLESDGWHHQRCDSEIAKYHSKAEVNRDVGKLGGRPKKINDVDNPTITDMVFENNPQVTLTTNHKPLTINQEPLTNINTITPEGVSDEVFKDFCKLRKGLKAPVTQTAMNGLAKEGQKANLTTLREFKKRLNLLSYNSKNFIFIFNFLFEKTCFKHGQCRNYIATPAVTLLTTLLYNIIVFTEILFI